MNDEYENGRGRKTPFTDGWRHHCHHDEDRSHQGRRRGGRMLDYGELRLLILAIISRRPSHGYELIKAVEEHFGGSYAPSPGVLYPTLAWLDDIGYAVAETGEGNRKSYRITQEGEAYLAANHLAIERLLARCGSNGEGMRSGAPEVVARAMDQLKTALRGRLKGRAVSESDIERIAAIVRDAAHRIENIEQPVSGQAGPDQTEKAGQ